MCGVNGEFRWDQRSPRPNLISEMNDKIVGRGPDAQGIYLTGPVCFGHRRLSIIDLSEKAAQPMVIPELDSVICYNGEIYNFADLKSQLSAKGHKFFSNSDTEVLLRGYYEWKESLLDRLQGMFAFAIYDIRNQEIFLARDRMGIKPFYFAKNSDRLLFSSSLPALLLDSEVDRSINKKALHHYMSFHAVVPAPDTILQGVQKLPSAHWMKINSNGDTTIRQYWEADYTQSDSTYRTWSEQDWESSIFDALRISVKRRLVADVPVGVFLSGGVDSSVITALMAEVYPQKINSYSVGFGDVGEESGNEFKYSNIVAQKFATNHHKINVKNEEILEHLPDCVSAMSEPMVSHDNIGFYLLSKFSSETDKVVQSGQGADEVFAGYHWYPPMIDSKNPVETYKNSFFDRSHEKMKEILHPEWIDEDYSQQFVHKFFSEQAKASPINQALRIDTNVMLVDDPVKRVDNMTMAWGLEARVPFLDHELVELVAQMPAKYKVNDGGKYILKKIARQLVPAEVIDRPKGYFPVPQLKYIEGPYFDLVHDLVNSQQFRSRQIFDENYVNTLLDNPKKYITPLGGSELWQIALLEFWLQRQGL